MPTLIKIGKRSVNLDLVTDIFYGDGQVEVSFQPIDTRDHQLHIVYTGAEAEALIAYLDGISENILEWKARTDEWNKRQAEVEKEMARVRERNDELPF